MDGGINPKKEKKEELLELLVVNLYLITILMG
jgi:hypothetical protein